MKFDPLVAQIINATNFNHFTTSEVRSAYLAVKKDGSINPSNLRRKIYAELLKLVKSGWLKKESSSKKGSTSFSKTKLFDVDVMGSMANISAINIKDKRERLLDKLNHYKTELLLNIGESEAYKELYSELPELIEELQPQYNEARDNNTRILGKIRAIEGLLKKHNP